MTSFDKNLKSKYLYHYTSFERFIKIYDDGVIKANNQDLFSGKVIDLVGRPVYCRGCYIDIDSFNKNSPTSRTVVWLSSEPDVKEDFGIDSVMGVSYDYVKVRLTFEYDESKFIGWNELLNQVNVDPERLSTFKNSHPDYETYYIHDGDLPYSDVVEVKVVDEYKNVYERLKKGLEIKFIEYDIVPEVYEDEETGESVEEYRYVVKL